MSKYLAIYGKPRYLGIIVFDGVNINKGEPIIVESHRGEELAVVAGELTDEQETSYRLLRNASEHGDAASKNGEPVVTDLLYIAPATDVDLETNSEYRQEEENILRSARELLKPHDLDMKLIDVEFLRNRRKLFFYFSSEQRVDFRAYVRDLAREFKTRIELRQIGVRDEAKIIRGVGPCGQPCCCSYWLNRFAPICIKMVKEQNLALNPAKISGICGRLMCCMCYEHNVYRELWAKLPNPGTKIKTPNGNVIVSGVEIHTNSVRCFISGRGEVKIPVEKFGEFKETVLAGKDWITEEQNDELRHSKEKNVLPDGYYTSDNSTAKKSEIIRQERKIQPEERTGSGVNVPKTSNKKRRRPRKLPAAGTDVPIDFNVQNQSRKQQNTISPVISDSKSDSSRQKPRRPRRRHSSGAKNVDKPVQE